MRAAVGTRATFGHRPTCVRADPPSPTSAQSVRDDESASDPPSPTSAQSVRDEESAATRASDEQHLFWANSPCRRCGSPVRSSFPHILPLHRMCAAPQASGRPSMERAAVGTQESETAAHTVPRGPPSTSNAAGSSSTRLHSQGRIRTHPRASTADADGVAEVIIEDGSETDNYDDAEVDELSKPWYHEI